MIKGSAATKTVLNRGPVAIAIVPNAWSENWKRRESHFFNRSVTR